MQKPKISAGKIVLTGTITVPVEKLELFRAALRVHQHLSELDNGCLVFTVTPDPQDICVYNVYERFVDQETFETHKQRSQRSDWWRVTGSFQRNYRETVIESQSGVSVPKEQTPHLQIPKMTLGAMRRRADELCSYVFRTPTTKLVSPEIASLLDSNAIYLKLECLQKTGTFKARSALSQILQIPADRRDAGITAASAGNHAIAAAWAARQCGLSAKVVMQSSANPFRVAYARAQGGEILIRQDGPAVFAEAERLVRDEGRTFVHPFEGPDVVLGTAGVGLEILEDVPDLDAIVVAVGGGGLISGIATAVRAVNPTCKVYGVEPKDAACMSSSLIAGEPITLKKVNTIADSLAPPMALPLGYAICSALVEKIVTVSDDDICAGMVVLQKEAKLAVEPAAGAAMAGLLGPLRAELQGKRIGLIVCGANIDTDGYLKLMNRGNAHVAGLLSV